MPPTSCQKAAGTSAGLTGLFGYLGGALFANAAMGYVGWPLGLGWWFWGSVASAFFHYFDSAYLEKEIQSLESKNYNQTHKNDQQTNISKIMTKSGIIFCCYYLYRLWFGRSSEPLPEK